MSKLRNKIENLLEVWVGKVNSVVLAGEVIELIKYQEGYDLWLENGMLVLPENLKVGDRVRFYDEDRVIMVKSIGEVVIGIYEDHMGEVEIEEGVVLC